MCAFTTSAINVLYLPLVPRKVSAHLTRRSRWSREVKHRADSEPGWNSTMYIHLYSAQGDSLVLKTREAFFPHPVSSDSPQYAASHCCPRHCHRPLISFFVSMLILTHTLASSSLWRRATNLSERPLMNTVMSMKDILSCKPSEHTSLFQHAITRALNGHCMRGNASYGFSLCRGGRGQP